LSSTLGERADEVGLGVVVIDAGRVGGANDAAHRLDDRVGNATHCYHGTGEVGLGHNLVFLDTQRAGDVDDSEHRSDDRADALVIADIPLDGEARGEGMAIPTKF
jgi:hypothetical protein